MWNVEFLIENNESMTLYNSSRRLSFIQRMIFKNVLGVELWGAEHRWSRFEAIKLQTFFKVLAARIAVSNCCLIAPRDNGLRHSMISLPLVFKFSQLKAHGRLNERVRYFYI